MKNPHCYSHTQMRNQTYQQRSDMIGSRLERFTEQTRYIDLVTREDFAEHITKAFCPKCEWPLAGICHIMHVSVNSKQCWSHQSVAWRKPKGSRYRQPIGTSNVQNGRNVQYKLPQNLVRYTSTHSSMN